MKKVIAAAAGLMLVGTMVGSALADVSFNGNARARYYYQQDYDFGASSEVTDEDGNGTGVFVRDREQDNKWHSRVRIQARATAAGGAYAVGRALYGNSTWDGGNSGSADIGADKAYIGVPIGPVTIEAGRVPMDLLKATKFFEQDFTADGAKVMFNASDAAEIGLLYVVDYEAMQNGDFVNDNDKLRYGAYAQLGFAGMSVRLAGMYLDDQVGVGADDGSGMYGGVEFTGPAGPIALSGAFAADDRGEERADTGYGGFLSGGMDFGGTGVALTAGFTSDGFVTDGDFGFIMIGGGASITPTKIGALGDTWFVGVPVTFAVSEMLSLKAILAYADFDTGGDAFEISGSAKYLISDGANFQWDIGYLGYSAEGADSVSEESPFGTAVTFNVSF